MESKGEEGKVLISETTLDLIIDHLDFFQLDEGPMVEV